MNTETVLEDPPIFVRVFARPKKFTKKKRPKPEPPNDDHALVLDTETTTDVYQKLRFGIAREYALDQLCRTIVVTGKVTDAEMPRIITWAKENHADVLPVERFIQEIFVPLSFNIRAVVVGFNLPFDLSRLAVEWTPTQRVGRKEHFTLRLVPRGSPFDAYTPQLRIQRVDSTKGFIHFVGTKERWRTFRGAFIDLRTFVHVLTGEKHSLETAGAAFGCSLKKTKVDYRGPVDSRFLDYALNDVALTHELYEKCLGRYREFGIGEHPSRLYSPASLAKAALRARGIVPPLLPPRWTGWIMSGFHAGKVELRIRGREVRDLAVLDFTSQFPSLWCLLGAERFQTAQRIRARRSTDETRAWLESLTVADLLRPETWRDPRMWTLCEIEASGELLPVRSTYSGKSTQPPTIGWNHVTTEKGTTLRYLVPDLIAAKLLCGRLPKIVSATTFEHVGRQEVRAIRLLGVDIGAEDDMVRSLTEARVREKTDKKPGWEPRAQGLKILSNALAYGISVEINRKRKAGTSTIYGLGEDPFEWDDSEIEEPGEDYCPLLGATLTSASHLLLALAETIVASEGGEVIYEDTDSVFVTPSRVASEVTEAFDSLNPYSIPTHFLKDETREKASSKEYPEGASEGHPSFIGLSCKRYALFARDKNGRPHVFRKAASDHGLGSFEVGGDRKEFIARVWESIIEDGARAGDRFAGIPATAQFALSTPQLLSRVKHLGPIRPFSFMTARYLEPSVASDGWRSELVPYVSKDDTASLDALMELPGQRDWSSIIDAFVRHHDRKCTFDANGRMVRRNVMVRKDRMHGIGKEANRIESSRVLGVGPTKARSQVYTPLGDRILALPLSWAEEHGIDKRNFARLRKRLKRGKPVTGYSGGFIQRIESLLMSQAIPPTRGLDSAQKRRKGVQQRFDIVRETDD